MIKISDVRRVINNKIVFHKNGVFCKEDLVQEAFLVLITKQKKYPDILKSPTLVNLVIFRSVLDYVCRNQYLYSISPKSARKHKHVKYIKVKSLEYFEDWNKIDLEMDLKGDELIVYKLLVENRSLIEISQMTGLSSDKIKKILLNIRSTYES